jgi:hypothetical protein
MTTLLAKILHPASAAASCGPEGEPRAPGPLKANKPRRLRMLAALTVPPAAIMLSLLSTGIANAEPVYFNGPDLSYGGPYVVHTQATADITCYAYTHQLHVYASAPSAQGEATSEQAFLYVARNGVWVLYGTGGRVQNQALSFTATYPPGAYLVIIRFGWSTTAGWKYVDGTVNRYTQWWRPGTVNDVTQYCSL